MVYAPQRRHAMASLTSIAQILAYLQYLHSPSLLILIARLLTHVQIQVISLIPPSRSLQNLALMLTLVNIVAGILHWLDSAHGGGGGGGMVLDFVGTRPLGLACVWILDVLIWGIHLLALVLSYINSIGGTHDYKRSTKFPYPDILLPPPPPAAPQSTPQTTPPFPFSFPFPFPFPWSSTSSKYGVIFQEDEDEQAGDDLESGEHHGGPSPAWGTSTPTSTSDPDPFPFPLPPPPSPPSPHWTNPPTIFSLSLSHLWTVIRYLPAPSPARVVEGGTPAVTPAATPAVTPRNERRGLAGMNRLGGAAAVGGISIGAESQSERAREREGADGEGRIPGSYWVNRDW
ncbi:hypothetical protein CNF00163 [Cryptococcus deneoformans JEC21]|uniref:DUF1746 domain-containing protein n=1 Tax=Cryptococcus deneoformans (strain JEC21 / ATCC MYA-565) TaxID=214684 RepID=A0A0S2M5F3_CRYD1|nr:hypothetical protein CNF00163 [Cryptococcus neoformans var. neoformans JEC21]ALO68965.1 hypothetical protein CNF00163 [Cryptococcus neoformans var. neoformans JEC21]